MDGITWSAVSRIPIDATNSGVDHFIPGIGVDRSTSGASARLALAYYYYPVAACNASNCDLTVGFTSSTNGGSTWAQARKVAGPFRMAWIAQTDQGPMVGDYISTSYDSAGLAHPVFSEAYVPTAGGTDCATATPNCDQPLETPTTGLARAAGALTANDPVVFTAAPGPGQSAFKHRR